MHCHYSLLVFFLQQIRTEVVSAWSGCIPPYPAQSPVQSRHTTYKRSGKKRKERWRGLTQCPEIPLRALQPPYSPRRQAGLTDMKWNLRTLSIPSAFSCRMTGAKLLRCISGTVDWGSLSKASSGDRKSELFEVKCHNQMQSLCQRDTFPSLIRGSRIPRSDAYDIMIYSYFIFRKDHSI